MTTVNDEDLCTVLSANPTSAAVDHGMFDLCSLSVLVSANCACCRMSGVNIVGVR